jgi:hypothetical protein
MRQKDCSLHEQNKIDIIRINIFAVVIASGDEMINKSKKIINLFER